MKRTLAVAAKAVTFLSVGFLINAVVAEACGWWTFKGAYPAMRSEFVRVTEGAARIQSSSGPGWRVVEWQSLPEDLAAVMQLLDRWGFGAQQAARSELRTGVGRATLVCSLE